MTNAMVMARRFTDWVQGTPNRTFVLYPLLVMLARRRITRPIFLPLLPWGYLQYHLIGGYRHKHHAGPRGFVSAPDRLLTGGPFRFSRNPMYLGHLIFLLGLALSTGSRLAWGILLANVAWFNQRVVYDEQRLRAKFGQEYEDYCRRVRRWI